MGPAAVSRIDSRNLDADNGGIGVIYTSKHPVVWRKALRHFRPTVPSQEVAELRKEIRDHNTHVGSRRAGCSEGRREYIVGNLL